MARVKISLPSKKLFEHRYTLTVSDMNYGGHMGNERPLALCHDLRINFLKTLSASELDLLGFGLIQTDAIVNYRAEAFQGDDLTGCLFLGEIGRSRFELCYQFKRISDDKEIFRALSGLSFFDYKERKVSPVPESLEQFLTKA
jgi:acyl-CoA thioesterase FadM